jgi:sulfite oxidase
MREVKKHKTAQTGIWMTFEDGVYDVTEFSKRHVWGGGVFLQAAGGPILESLPLPQITRD